MIRRWMNIDSFRFIASLLVVMIHIDPFVEPLNYVMTRLIGRLAVPFFMMTTSYFLYRNYTREKWRITVSKLCILYVLTTLLYFPLMLYSGQVTTVSMFFQDFLLNGTFYHLWYFPAMIIGLCIVEGLRRYCTPKVSWILVILLYLIGLGGDSYGNLFRNTMFYEWIRSMMAYTRNGLFFSPLMIMLGIEATRYKMRTVWISIIIVVFYSLEMILIKINGWAIHDAMTIFLPMMSFILFQWLVAHTSARHILTAKLSMWIYLLHPWMIVVVRGLATWSGWLFLKENALVLFILTTMLSIGTGWLIEWGKQL